jgi:hypothetical protein
VFNVILDKVVPTETLLKLLCNISYSEGRDQEDHSSKPTGTNSSQDPILKKTHHKKRTDGVAKAIGPEFKSHFPQKRNILKREIRTIF